MPRGIWSKKDERQYKAVLRSCLKKDGRKTKSCKSMAAAVVNKRRGVEGRTKKKTTGWLTLVAVLDRTVFVKLPPFNPRKFGVKRASKYECLYKSGRRKGLAKPGCVWGWGKYRGKLFKKA